MTYKPIHKGDTTSKIINRGLVWLQHQHLLGKTFTTVPHVFLASKHAGDVGLLKELGIHPNNIWAVENSYTEYKHLFELQRKHNFRLFTDNVCEVVEDFPTHSLYLDFCGNMEGDGKLLEKITPRLQNGVVLTVTFHLGREQKKPVNRESYLLQLLRSHTSLHVVLTQEIRYLSFGVGLHSSLMGSWTFQLSSKKTFCEPKRFDLTKTKTINDTSISWIKNLWSSNTSTLITLNQDKDNGMLFEISTSSAVSTIIRATLENPAAAKEYLRKLQKIDETKTKKVKLSVSERQRQAAFKAWATRRNQNS